MNYENRITELEQALTNLLDLFDETPEGVTVETEDGVGRLTEDATYVLTATKEVLYNNEEGLDDGC